MTNANDLTFSPTLYKETFDAINYPNSGLTKREYFAAMAMQGLLASIGGHDVTDYNDIAHDARMAADALINELNK